MPKDQELETILSEFADRLTSVVERRAVNRIGALLAPVMQGHAIPNGHAQNGQRRAHVQQLCPVPGCGNVAAPRYGMVCTQHKDLPKAEIKKYREARKAEKKAAKRSSAVVAVAGAGPRRGRRPAVPVR